MEYTAENYKTQISVIKSQIKADEKRLANIDKIPEDARENHKRTIKMRLDACNKRMSVIENKLEQMLAGN